MFSGIIEHVGRIVLIQKEIFTIDVGGFGRKLKKGSSITINGVCLTVIEKNKSKIQIEVIPETLKRTNFSHLKKGERVNLELPLKLSDFIDGHMVLGHIDGTGEVLGIFKRSNSRILKIKPLKNLLRYFIPKGSVALDGISLTVINVTPKYFTVGIIPYTFKNTNMQNIKKGSKVNIEVDIFAKYIERLCKK